MVNDVNGIINIGGIRVDLMKLYPDKKDMNKYQIKRFFYSYNGQKNIGKLIANRGIEHNFSFSKKEVFLENIFSNSIIVNSEPYYSLKLPGCANVEYDRVVEQEEDMHGNGLGRKEYIFSMSGVPQIYYSRKFPYSNESFRPNDLGDEMYDFFDPEHLNIIGWDYDKAYFIPVRSYYPISERPQLISEKYFDKDNNLVKDIHRIYEVSNEANEQVVGFYVSSSVYEQRSPRFLYSGSSLTPNNNLYLPTKFNYFLYEIPIGKKVLSSQITNTYSNGNMISEIVNYEYEAVNGMLRKRTTITSNKKESSVFYYYPFDYSSTIANINTLNQKHVVELPIMQVNKINGKIESANIKEIDEFTNVRSVYKFNNDFSFNFDPSRIIPESGFEKYADFIYSEGRLIEAKTREGVVESFLYGSTGQYPVAKIIGCDYTTANKVVSKNQIDQARLNDIYLRRLLHTLRTDTRTKNALITTYTYTPLVGITSETDPSGRIAFYDYDSFGRLSAIKDEKGNILKGFCYNYAGQLIDCNITLNNKPQWDETGSVRCTKDVNQNNTGYQEKEERDVNSNSTSFNQVRWVNIGSNTIACPLPTVPTVNIQLQSIFGQFVITPIKIDFIQNGVIKVSANFPALNNEVNNISIPSGFYQMRINVPTVYASYAGLGFSMNPGILMLDRDFNDLSYFTPSVLEFNSNQTYTIIANSSDIQ